MITSRDHQWKSESVDPDSTTLPKIQHRTLSTSTHLLLAGAILLALVDGLAFFPIETRLVLAVSVVVLTSFGMLNLVLRAEGNAQGFALWRLGPWYLTWGALTFGVTSLDWITPKTGTPGIIGQQSVVMALYVFAVATVAWTSGYLIGTPSIVLRSMGSLVKIVSGGTRSSLRKGWFVPWAMYGAGALARIAEAILNGSVGYLGNPEESVSSANGYTQLIRSATMLSIFALAVASYRLFEKREGGITLAIMLTAEVATGAFLGMKESFLTAALAVILPYGIARRRMPVKALVAVALGFLLVIMPFNSAYRSVLRGGGSTLTMEQASGAAPDVLAETINANGLTRTLSESYDATIYRLGLIDNVAIIVQRTPTEIAYRSPLEYLYAPFVGLVPRAVWPDKPILATGYEFSHEYYDLPTFLYTSSAVTLVGDFFRHGGWIAVMILSFVFGAIYRCFDQMLRPERNISSMFFLLALLPVTVKSEMDSVTLLSALPSLVFTAAIGVRAACQGDRKKILM
jgi:hypothetical protein